MINKVFLKHKRLVKDVNIILYTQIEFLQIIFPQTTPTGQRTEKKTVKVVCCSNLKDGIYLRWKNTVGGIDGWLFNTRVTDDFQVSTNEKYEKLNSELTRNDKLQVVKKTSRQQYLCYATFERKNLHGFKSLLKSELVQMLVDVDNKKFANVDVELVSLRNINTENQCKIAIKVIMANNER